MAKVRAPSMRPLSLQELAIACALSCSDFRLTSRVSHNRTERALQLASQHVASPAQRCWSCQSCPAAPSMYRRARSYAGSPNMKVDRIGTLYNSLLYTRYLRGLHIENVIHSRKTPSSLRPPPDCRGESVCVGIARKKYRILEIYPFSARKPVLICRGGLQEER